MRGTLPDAILNKRKGGFNAPVPRWLKGELAPHVHHYLGADRIRAGGVFDPATVSRLVADHEAGRADYSRNLWALLTFAVWQERAPVDQVPGNGAAVARTVRKEAAAR
jgi:asparagine synthase (glutamine-hydrolysing)